MFRGIDSISEHLIEMSEGDFLLDFLALLDFFQRGRVEEVEAVVTEDHVLR